MLRGIRIQPAFCGEGSKCELRQDLTPGAKKRFVLFTSCKQELKQDLMPTRAETTTFQVQIRSYFFATSDFILFQHRYNIR